MGGGKTLLTVIYAEHYAKMNPDNPIFANFHIALQNFIYTPFIMLPFSQLKKCLIIADDFYALKTAEGLIEVITCYSRKRNIDIILTTQYYSDIKLKLRTLCHNLIEVKYDKINDILYIANLDKNNHVFKYLVKNAVSTYGKLYDTEEVVEFPTDRKMEIEILKNSKSIEDLEVNCSMVWKNRGLQSREFEKLRQKL